MALQLFRLASSPMSKISATTSQAAFQYFHNWSRSYTHIVSTVVVTLHALSTWFKGNGTTLTGTGFKTGASSNVLSINGVMQQSGLYTIAAGSITLTAPAGGLTFNYREPITLQTYNANSTLVISKTKTFAVP